MLNQAGSPQREGSSVVVKVLYIEDNDDDVYMLKMRLELLGNFEVLTAADGEKGCEVAAAEQPDIILMDIEMPVVDGWGAARRLKDNSHTQHRLVRTCACRRAREGDCHGVRGVRHQTDRIRSASRNRSAGTGWPHVSHS